MTTYNPSEIERLVREAREDDASLRAPPPGCSCLGAAFCEDWCPAYPWAMAQSAATERCEANLRAMADQLEAARVQVERIPDLQAAIGYEIERRDAALAQLEAARARIAELEAAVELVIQGCEVAAASLDAYRAKLRGAG